MDDGVGTCDSVRQLSVKQSGSYRPTLSGRSTPRTSPSLRRLHSSRTPRREARNIEGSVTRWFKSTPLVYWLLLITLWTYVGFYVQSKWAHSENKEEMFLFGSTQSAEISASEKNEGKYLTATENSLIVDKDIYKTNYVPGKRIDVILAKKKDDVSLSKSMYTKKRNKKTQKSLHGAPKTTSGSKMEEQEQEQEILKRNTTYGILVGPFGSIEDDILGWSPAKRSETCGRTRKFAHLVWSKKIVLIFHELSFTGAPLSMLELGIELLSCGATVSAVVLSKKGGLLPELSRRGINVLEDRGELSFKLAKKADLIIAGSAVCASWIEKYMSHFTTGSSQVAWWIMENRLEYFNRSKFVLDSVKALIFLSESQSEQWRIWCDKENIKLHSQPKVVPLSVNDELAFVAGIKSSHNTPAFSTETMLAKRELLRDAVRKEMGLTDNDMLVMTLNSINPGKGQFLLFQSAHLLNERNLSRYDSERSSAQVGKNDLSIKFIVGSVGSKSNKIPYVKGLLGFISHHSNLSKSVLWTPATTRVAALYSAADVYVINSQGLGETFGRVTIEAMAFGLPILGTDAGGTKEIVEHDVTGLLHPLGKPGIRVLAQNLQLLLHNPSTRKKMGMEGRKKVEREFLNQQMYETIAEVLSLCTRINIVGKTVLGVGTDAEGTNKIVKHSVAN